MKALGTCGVCHRSSSDGAHRGSPGGGGSLCGVRQPYPPIREKDRSGQHQHLSLCLFIGRVFPWLTSLQEDPAPARLAASLPMVGGPQSPPASGRALPHLNTAHVPADVTATSPYAFLTLPSSRPLPAPS